MQPGQIAFLTENREGINATLQLLMVQCIHRYIYRNI